MAGIPGSRVARLVAPLRRSRQEWLFDAACTLVAFGIGMVFLLGTMDEDPEVGDHVPAQVIVGVLVSIVFLLVRRACPVLLAWPCVPLGFVYVPVSGVTVAGIFGVAAYRRPRTALAVTAVHSVLVGLLFHVASEDRTEYWSATAVFVILDLVALTSGLLVRSHRMLVDSLKERARQAEYEQRLRVEEARHLERERIAREMHDVLAHRISLLAVHAGALEVRADASPQEARAAGVIREAAHDALEDLRDVIRMLRTADPGPDDSGDRPQPTLADLPALVDQSRRTGASVEFSFAAEGVDAPARLGRHAYRIVQEGLTNARKHAPGARVRVDVRFDADEPAGLAIEVANPLDAMAAVSPAMPGAGAGLIGLRERVTLVGGRLEHGTEGNEFRLRAWLPWQS